MSRGVEKGPRGRAAALAVAAGLIAGVFATSAHAYVPTGSDFRISNVFTDGDATRVGTHSDVAYNSSANEYLVVFRADVGGDDDFDIWGRRVSAAGAPLGNDFQISNVVGADRTAQLPDVAYNATADEYLVVWSGDGLTTNDEFEIFGRRVSAAGVPVPGPDVRLSEVGPVNDAARDAEAPAVAYNPSANQYLVAWQADDLDLTDDKIEIFARLFSATLVPIAADFRISNGGPDSDQLFDATLPDAVFNTTAGEYLIVWQGEGFNDAEGVTEIWAQRVSAAGVPDNVQGDLRISDLGSDTDPTMDALSPSVTYNSHNNAYFTVWRDDGYTGAADGEFEIFGQRISAIGDEQADDFRLSTVGANGDASRAAGPPAVARSGSANEYLVVWHGDGLATDGELEIFGQRLDANGGQLAGDQRISSAGPDGNAMFDAEDPSIAFSSTSNGFLATWTADDLGTNDEFEIFGRRLAPAPPVTAATPPPPPPRAYELPKKKCKKKKKKKKKGKALAAAAKKKKKKKKKKKC